MLHVDQDQRGKDAGQGVQHQGQVDAVQEPDVVAAVDPAEPGVAEDAEGEEGEADS